MTLLLAAFFTDIEKNFERFVMNCLAVAGAYVVGYVGTGLLLASLDKWVFKKQKPPEFLKKSIRVLTGLVLALLVALYLFRGFGSGGDGPGGPGTGVGDSNNDKKGDEPKALPKDVITPRPIDVPNKTGDRTAVRVTFLGGGDVVEGRAYLLDDERPAKTFAQLTDAIKKRKAAEPHGIKLYLGRTGADPVARQSTGVKALEEWAERERIGYEWPEDDKKTP